MPKRYLLSIIYFGRALSIVGLITLPPSTASTLIFGAVTGLLWLSTVPPTSGLVALMFGTRWLTMLFGFAFFSHQVGGFLGVWLGGLGVRGDRLLRPGLVAVGVLRRRLGGDQSADRREAGGAAGRGRGIIAAMSDRLASSTPGARRSSFCVCGCLIGLIGFGPRSTFGFFLTPMTAANGWGRDVFALALAIEMLLWGAAQPFAGALADRFGAVWVLIGGALLYVDRHRLDGLCARRRWSFTCRPAC